MINAEKEEPMEVSVLLTSSLGDYPKAIEYHEKHLKIAKEMGDQGGEGRAYGHLGDAYQSLCDYQKAIEYQVKHLKIAKEMGDQSRRGTSLCKSCYCLPVTG